jgi:Dolichyl-phosphate-mannose-protein mannosyltransferase
MQLDANTPRMMKKIVFIALILLTLCRMGFFLYSNKEKYANDYWSRYPTLKTVFEGSQYMMKDWKFWIPDETVYSYAAGAYVKGANPILVESTQPPLGKYLMALSVVLFNNENVIVALFFAFFLIGVGWTAYLLSKNSIVSGISVLLLMCDSLFTNQLRYMPLLDIFEVTFIVWGIACVARGLHKSVRWMFVLGLVFIGLSMMTKVWVTGAVFLCVVTLYTIIVDRPYIKYLFVGYGIIFAILLVVYAKTIVSGYSPLEILKVQKWLFWYHESKINRFFTIWPLIFLNKWYVWWGTEPIIKEAQWSVLWPVTTGIFLVEIVRKLYRRAISYHNGVWDVFFYSMLVYLFFMSMGQANARYLLPFLVLGYPFCCALVYRGIFMKRKK